MAITPEPFELEWLPVFLSKICKFAHFQEKEKW